MSPMRMETLSKVQKLQHEFKNWKESEFGARETVPDNHEDRKNLKPKESRLEHRH